MLGVEHTLTPLVSREHVHSQITGGLQGQDDCLF